MSVTSAVVLVLATVIVMEGVAWAAHKYVMHRWGWRWHRSHHEPHVGWFELNDLYAMLFAIFAIGLFIFASRIWQPLLWIAVGMTLYGVLYALVHDGLVHQRWPFRLRLRHPYLKRLVQAHRLHHAVEGRDDCVSFGFLYAAPVRDLKQGLRRLHPGGLSADTLE